MKKIIAFIALFACITGTFGQLNMAELGRLDIPETHTTELNDIWGYTDEAGNEYALVGTMDGVSIVDVTDPSAPTEVFWTPGSNSIWRDLKTYNDYLYVTTEALDGLMIIDLSPLPESTDLDVTFYTGPELNPWESAHNLYMSDGYVYIFGAGRDNGGVIILDVATDPLNPIEVGVFDDWYAHDGYVQDDTAYFAHIYDGFFSVVDVTDKTAPELLGTAITPTNFSHNIWASEDGDFVYTTDEVSGAFIGAFDVSDPSSIIQLDQIQSSPGEGIIPHNSHVKGNYLYTSYYTDGVVIHDITYPNNLIEVANYDTSPFDTPNFQGCWGVYPFFESGTIVASDRKEGLIVLSAAPHQGSYLEGNVTELGTGMPVNNVQITIEGETTVDQSNLFGDYATGIENEGTRAVTYFKVLYYPQTFDLPFENGEITVQDVALERIPEYAINVKVLDAATLDPIEGAGVRLQHTYVAEEGLTNADGILEVPLYYQDNYQVSAGKWGYVTDCFVDTLITDETVEIILYLDQGIYDDFTFDFGWTEASTASRGAWEREIPVGVANGDGEVQNPFADVTSDCGNLAYLTGNGTTVSNTEEVNDGVVFLFSPPFDLTGYDNPHVNFASWFFCKYGAEPNDTLEVFVANGTGEIVRIAHFYNGGLPMSQWNYSSIALEPLVEITATMQVFLRLSDELETENITEGGIDHFSITNFSVTATEPTVDPNQHIIELYPNPFNNTLNINGVSAGWVTVYDVSGRFITERAIQPTIGLGDLEAGTYFFVISDADRNQLDVITQVKH